MLHLQRLDAQAREQDIRNFLGGFNFHGDMAVGSIRHFSGGEKARLALAIVVWQKPNLLLLDEPTNHLDLEMCHALTMALQVFEGAVIIVSHDRHLLRNTVDQFLLIAGGKAQAYDGDLDDYSRWLISQRKQDAPASTPGSDSTGKTGKKEQRQQAAEIRKQLNPISNAIKKIEHKMEKTDKLLKDMEAELGDNDLYKANNNEKLQQLLRQQGHLKLEKNHDEERWFELTEKLESLQDELASQG